MVFDGWRFETWIYNIHPAQLESACRGDDAGAGSCGGRYCEILCGTHPTPSFLVQPPSNLSIPASLSLSISGVVSGIIRVVTS
jgi:hypothetical protein